MKSKTHHRNWLRWLIWGLVAAGVWLWPVSQTLYYLKVTTDVQDYLTSKVPTDFSLFPQVKPPEDAELTAVYDGVGGRWGGSDFWVTLLTSKTRTIGGWRFYRDPEQTSEDTRKRVSVLMKNPLLYQEFRGEKQCFGYYPDYCLEWKSSEGWFYALVCTGCCEVIFYGRGKKLRCDLQDNESGYLMKLLQRK